MIDRLILFFVMHYIKKNMAHGNNRNEIFRAINDGAASNFPEDNNFSLFYFIVGEVFENGPIIGSVNKIDREKIIKTLTSGVNHELERRTI